MTTDWSWRDSISFTQASAQALLHGGSPKGDDLIACRPHWTRHAKAGPFKYNDAMVDTLPIGVLHFPGTGIQDNLADKAKTLGIPAWRFEGA